MGTTFVPKSGNMGSGVHTLGRMWREQ